MKIWKARGGFKADSLTAKRRVKKEMLKKITFFEI